MIVKPSLGQILSVNYRQHPRYRGCIGHWIMAEGGGATLYDLSGNGTHGAITGSPWLVGKYGYALDHASGQYTNLGDKALLRPGTGAWTVFCRAFITSSTTARYFVDKTGSNPYPGYALLINYAATGAAQFYVETNSSTNYRITVSDNSIADNKFHDLCGVADPRADQCTLYLDGLEIAQTRTSAGSWPNVTNTANLNIGRWGQSGEDYYDDLIEEVRIYNRALTPGEISSLYQEPFLEFEEDADDFFSFFDLAAQRRRASAARVLQPYNLCEPFPGTE